MAEAAAAAETASISSLEDDDFSSSSSDEMDDHAATSSPSEKGMHDGDGPLYEMSSLAVQLPFKLVMCWCFNIYDRSLAAPSSSIT